MRARRAWLIVVALVAALNLRASETRLQVQLSFYPYSQDPEPAWRVSIFDDGSVRCEQSAEPVKVASVSPDVVTNWVGQSDCPTDRISPRVQRTMLAGLRSLGLNGLAQQYSADFSYTVPGETTTVTTSSGDSYSEPATAYRLVTHGAYYGLRISLADVSVDSFVYAPFSALEQQAPVNPDRGAIAKIVKGWYCVLKAVGPTNGVRAEMFRVE